jgi:hypothetical protein
MAQTRYPTQAKNTKPPAPVMPAKAPAAKTASPAPRSRSAVTPGGKKPKSTHAKVTVEEKRLADVKEHPRNPRIHPEEGSAEWDVLVTSLQEDYFDPIVWNKKNNCLVSGHLRRKVLMSLGYETADMVVVSYDEKTHIARMIAANKEVGHDDRGALKNLFKELVSADFNLDLTGFSVNDLEPFSLGDTAFDDAENLGGGTGQEGREGQGPGGDQVGSTVRYVQLLYTNDAYGEFQELLKDYRKAKAKALTEAYPDEDAESLDAAEVLLFMLRSQKKGK